MMRRLSSERGQASIELLGALPLLLLVAAIVWQAHMTAAASNAVESAARTAARVGSLGGDPQRAARFALPEAQRPSADIRVVGDRVEIETDTPLIVSDHTLGYRVKGSAEIPGD